MPVSPPVVCQKCNGKMEAEPGCTEWTKGLEPYGYVFGYVCQSCGNEEALLVHANGEVPKRKLYSDASHAVYMIADNERGEPLLIMDIGTGKRKSVTTDIVRVLGELEGSGVLYNCGVCEDCDDDCLTARFPPRRLFYIDAQGVTAEVMLKGKKFDGWREHPYYTKEVAHG